MTTQRILTRPFLLAFTLLALAGPAGAQGVPDPSSLPIEPLAPDPTSMLVVNTDAADTRVDVDGKPWGTGETARQPKEIAPGPHEVMVSAPGRGGITLSVVVPEGETTTLGVTLPAAPTTKAPAPVEHALRVAVYDLELADVDPRVGRVVTEAVVAEMRKLEGVSVIGMDEVRQMLDHEAQRQMVGCEDDSSCLAEIAGALGADVLVTGQLARLEDEHVMGLKRIEQTTAKVAGGVNHRLQRGSGEEFLAVVGPSIEELFADKPLRAGETRGVTEQMALLLDPPPLPTWVFWSALTATGVTTLAAGTLAGVWGLLRFQFESYKAGGAQLDGATLNGMATQANVALLASATVAGGAALLGCATAGVSFFTDWHDYAAAAEALEVE